MIARTGTVSEQSERIESWKGIAAFFDRDERTVKRWEKERGLPIHRLPGDRGGVFAYAQELNLWRDRALEPGATAGEAAASPIVAGIGGTAVFGEALPGADGETEETSRAVADRGSPVGRRKPLTPARAIAWLAPLAVSAALLFSLSGGRSGGHGAPARERGSANGGTPALGSDSVAVLPFSNAGGEASSDFLCDGITESLIGNLAHIPELKVRSRDAVFRLRGEDVAVQQAGSRLGVAEVVSGRVTTQGSAIAISTELTDVRSNTEIWGKQYSGKTGDLIELQRQIAGDLADALRSKLSAAEREQVTRQGTQNAAAYTLYLKGRYAFNLRDRAKLEAAISWFNQAIEKDPGYALAYSGLADAYSVLPNFYGNPNEDSPRSNAAARKALELDPSLAHPHAVLGSNEMEYDWDFAGGEAEFRKSFALDPNDATAHQWFAERISALGRHQEALAEIHRAHELDPLSPVITRVTAGTLVDAGQYDPAIEICKQLVRENPAFPMAHDCLVYAYWGKGLYGQVVEEWKIEGQLTGDADDLEFSDALERGYRSGGWKGAEASAVKVVEARRQRSYGSPFIIGRFYADMGEKDKAFDWLEQAYREHDRLLPMLEVAPGFASVRGDPRFAELARRVGLPPVE